MNNNNNNNQFEILDLIAMISFVMQLQNIQLDDKQQNYIHNVIKTLAQQVEKLHKQNDRIETKLDQILKILKEK